MKMFDDIFDKTFKKYVLMDTFRLPMCVKELRLFSEKICQSFLEEYSNHHSLTLSSSSKSLSPRSMKQYTSLSTRSNKSSSNSSPIKNALIGINSLSKTFNIIKILGKTMKVDIYVLGTAWPVLLIFGQIFLVNVFHTFQ